MVFYIRRATEIFTKLYISNFIAKVTVSSRCRLTRFRKCNGDFRAGSEGIAIGADGFRMLFVREGADGHWPDAEGY